VTRTLFPGALDDARPTPSRRPRTKFSFDEAPTKPRGTTTLAFTEPELPHPPPPRPSRPSAPAVAKARRPTLQRIQPRPPRDEAATVRNPPARPIRTAPDVHPLAIIRAMPCPPPLPAMTSKRASAPPKARAKSEPPETEFPLTRAKSEPPVRDSEAPSLSSVIEHNRAPLLPTVLAPRRSSTRWWKASMVFLSAYVAAEVVLATCPAIGVAADDTVERIGSFFSPKPR
jgi:flagellar protein FliO/FliZ